MWNSNSFKKHFEREILKVTNEADQDYITREQFRKLIPRLKIEKGNPPPEFYNDLYDHIRKKDSKVNTERARAFLCDIRKKQWCKENGKLYIPTY